MQDDFCACDTAAKREALAGRQLAAVAAREAEIQAFVRLDVRAALATIAHPRSGALAGALVGVKDIISTAAFPTLYGSPFPENAGPRRDAWCVGELLRLGAAVLGKTVSTEFAFSRPGPTLNPHDPRRTPGGSSSGSAAAVSAGFVSFALGTQTGGSVIRPASFCGVVGYKPSFGLLHTDGVQAISTTLDHLGVFARSPRDAWFLTSALLGPQAEILRPRRPERVLCLRFPPELLAGDGYPDRMAELAAALAGSGVAVEVADLPFPIEDFAHLQETLCYWEAARILLAPGQMRLTDQLTALLRPYLAMAFEPYAAARARRQAHQSAFAALAARFDAVLMPAAPGAAPLSLEHTGDAIMNRFWTALHVPAVTVPIWRSPEGLPLGLQLVGGLGSDRDLLQTAQWFHEDGALP